MPLTCWRRCAGWRAMHLWQPCTWRLRCKAAAGTTNPLTQPSLPPPAAPLMSCACQVGALLDRLAAEAAAKLGLPSVPPDAELLPRLLNFTQQYLFDFEPDDSSHGG